MLGYRCSKCGYFTVIKRIRCRKCRSREFTTVDINYGKLVNITTVYVTRPSYPSPLRLGLVKLGDSTHVLAQVSDDDLEIGMHVRIEVGDDNIIRIFRKD